MKNLILSILIFHPLVSSVQAQNIYNYPDLVESEDSVSITVPLSIEVLERPNDLIKN